MRIHLLPVWALFLSSWLPADDYRPRNTQKPGEEPPSAEEAAGLITVPEGFQVRLFAGDPDVRQPVAMAFDDRGRLFVAESYSYKEWKKKGEDRVLIFEDTDNDGRHDSRKVFVSGIDHLSGMTVGRGGVWVCSSPHLLFYPDADRDDVPDGEPEVVLDGWTTGAGHNFFNGLTWGPDGWLYGRHGITRPSLVGAPGTPDEERTGLDCSIWRYHPVDGTFEVVCRGTTNPWGLDWNEKGDLFFTNNVNGHLWHAIPGAYYPRMGNRNDPFATFVYDRIGMCCDHLHHAGEHTDWTRTRDGKGVHGELGGGHSHCGGMIYRGGKWPEKYHGRMFMCNTHGRRINVDRLDEEGPTYVGRHEEDFLFANNPWFRGVEILYGPDGDVYVSDWVDLGECHDNDGVHRTSGRIYKVIYGEPSPPMKEKLWEMGDDELRALARDHPNHWYRRQIDGILRNRNPDNFIDVEGILLGDDFRTALSWAKRDGGALRRLASNLRLHPRGHRMENAGLLIRACPAHHPTTDLLVYFAIKDIAASEPEKAEELLVAAEDEHYPFTKNLARNLAENGVFAPLISRLESSGNEALSRVLLEGFAAGIRGQKEPAVPAGWEEVFLSCWKHPDLRAGALAVHIVFDEEGSREKLAELLRGKKAFGGPQQALSILMDHPVSGLVPPLLPLLDDPDLAPEAIAVLGGMNGGAIAGALIERFGAFSVPARQAAINVLSGKKAFAVHLIRAIEEKRIPRHAMTAYHARQIRTFRDKELDAALTRVWGRTGSTSGEKKARIKHWQDQLLPDVLADADLENGHARFQQLCLACHRLHGEGGKLGPELTGANRGDLYYLLENIIDPNATLPADFQITVVTKKDGTIVSGNVNAENEYSLTLGGLGGETLLQKDEIAKRETLEQSLMPEGLLATLQPDDVRDLIAFLQSNP